MNQGRLLSYYLFSTYLTAAAVQGVFNKYFLQCDFCSILSSDSLIAALPTVRTAHLGRTTLSENWTQRHSQSLCFSPLLHTRPLPRAVPQMSLFGYRHSSGTPLPPVSLASVCCFWR